MRIIQLLIIAIFGIAVLACQPSHKVSKDTNNTTTSISSFQLPDSLSSRRISFVLNLRELVSEKYWKEFGEKEVEGAFNYFNGDQSEIFFPSEQVLKSLEGYQIFSDDYIVGPRTDSIPYHFELMISFDPADTSKFYYDHPVQQFLSVEETGNYIPSVKSSEMWTTMVIHEMFHHFQYNNQAFKEYAKTDIVSLPFDIRNLRKMCEEDASFLKMIQQENDYLLRAIDEENEGDRTVLIKNYLRARSKRIENYEQEYPYLEKVENYYIVQEGAARYVEYLSMNVLMNLANQLNPPVIKDDPKFLSYQEFKVFDLEKEEFNYLTYAGASNYHYTLGFNQIRLLDKLEIVYQQHLFNRPEKALHTYFEDYMSTLAKLNN